MGVTITKGNESVAVDDHRKIVTNLCYSMLVGSILGFLIGTFLGDLMGNSSRVDWRMAHTRVFYYFGVVWR